MAKCNENEKLYIDGISVLSFFSLLFLRCLRAIHSGSTLFVFISVFLLRSLFSISTLFFNAFKVYDLHFFFYFHSSIYHHFILPSISMRPKVDFGACFMFSFVILMKALNLYFCA